MIRDQFDGNRVTLFKDEDDNVWIAYFAKLPNVSAIGDTTEEALYELGEAWCLFKESESADIKKEG